MKKFFFILTLTLFSFFNLLAQVPDTIWTRSYGGSMYDEVMSVVETADGGLVLVGYTSSGDGDIYGHHGGIDDGWVIKIDQSGDTLWTKTFGGSHLDYFYDVKETNDGGLVVVGATFSDDGDLNTNKGDSDAWAIKLDSFGNKEWSTVYGGQYDEVFKSVAITEDENIYCAGYAESPDGDVHGNHGNKDIWLLKLNNTGDTIWTKTYGGSKADFAQSITLKNNSELLITGGSQSDDGDLTNNNGSYDAFTIKTDSLGNALWLKSFGGSHDDRANDIIYTSDNSIVMACVTYSTDGQIINNHGGYDYWIIKLTDEGGLLWTKTFGGSANDTPKSIIESKDKKYIIVGCSSSKDEDVSIGFGNCDYWIIKVDTSGSLNWEQSLGGSDTDFATSLLQTSEMELIVAGYSSSIDGYISGSHGDTDFWIVKLEGELCYPPTDLTASNFSANSAEISWTENGTATTWGIMLDTAGFDTTGVIPITVTENPYIYEGLTQDTKYDWFVWSVCGEGLYSEWAGPGTFSTDCEQEFEAPFIEDFETTEIGEIPDCWRTINTNPEEFSIEVTGESQKVMKFEVNNDFSPLILITPRLDDLTAQDKQISFFAKFPFHPYFDCCPYISVGTISDPSDPETFTEFQEIGLTDVYSEYTVRFDTNYKLTDKYIALKSGPHMFAKYGGTGNTFLDDFIYSEITDTDLLPVNLPFIEDFELSSGQRKNNGKLFYHSERRWDFIVNPDHELSLDWGTYSGLPYSGSGAMNKSIIMDYAKTPSPILTLNLGNYQLSSDLKLSLYYFYEEPDWADNTEDIFVRGSQDDDWLLLYSFNLDSLEEEIYHFIDGLDIDETLASASPMQEVSSTFQLKFESQMEFGSSVIYDLISITCSPPLISRWPLNETTGTLAEDVAGDNDGTLINDPLWIPGIKEGALQFDGINDRVDCGTDSNLDMGTNDFTIATWVKMETSQTSYPTFIAKGGGATYDAGYWFYHKNNRLKFYLSDGSTRINAYSDQVSLKGSNWHHIAVVADRDGNASFYVDGDQAGTFDISAFDGTNIQSAKSLTLGSWMSNTISLLNGAMDDVRLYNIALSEDEIQMLAESQPIARAHWPMNEGVGTQTEDIAGSNDGMLINGPIWVTGIDDNALQFDGSNDRVDCGSNSGLNMGKNDFSISTWVNLETSQTAYPTFVAIGGGATYDPGYWFHYNSNRLKFYLSDGTTRINAQSNTLNLKGTGWHHLVVVANRDDKAMFYVDGEAQGTFDISSLENSNIQSTKSLTLGSWMSSSNSLLNGIMDETILYDVTLDQTQIDELYALYSANKSVAPINSNDLSNAKLLVYPNPTKGQLNIKFEVEEQGYTTLSLYDYTGNEVARLFEENSDAEKEYTFEFNAVNLRDGMYIVRLQSSNGVNLVRKIILQK